MLLFRNISRVVGVSTLHTEASHEVLLQKFKWTRFYQRAGTPINSSNNYMTVTCILPYFIWVTTYHQSTPLQVSSISLSSTRPISNRPEFRGWGSDLSS